MFRPINPLSSCAGPFALIGVLCLTMPAVASGAQQPGELRADAANDDPGAAGIEAASTRFVGMVVDAKGAPESRAVVLTSAGGQTVTDFDGSFQLTVRIPPHSTSVQVTAVAGSGAGSRVASAQIVTPIAGGVISTGTLTLQATAGCQASWLPTFGQQQGTSNGIDALTVFDDGTGPALYAGGVFSNAGGVVTFGVAKWDGSRWSAVGSWMNSFVHAMTVFDDGSGPALYAGGVTRGGGVPVNYVARWNGVSWSPVGPGMNGSVNVLAVVDDGSGPALFAGGSFTYAGGFLASRVAKWTGASWSALGTGVSGAVYDLTTFDDGSGPALYACGSFSAAGGVAANNVAKWDGSTWSDLRTGLNNAAYVLAVFDDGGGPELIVGGPFTTAGSASANCLAKWDGSSWSPLGSGMSGGTPYVSALSVYDAGSGPALYAGGLFSSAGGVATDNVAVWNGSSWSAAGAGLQSLVTCMTVFDDGSRPALYSGGDFFTAGTVETGHIAKWDGSSWSALGDGMNGPVLALLVFDDGSGPALYAGGRFTTAVGGVAVNRIAKWDGVAWRSLGGGMSHAVKALAVFDDGSGPAIHAGGSFTIAGGFPAERIAKWNGLSWSALGSGMDNDVNALTVFDDGSGPALHAGGWFTTAAGVVVNGIAKWNGSAWSPLGSGMDYHVYALLVFDDGTGPALYAGGYFTTAGGVVANHVAKWNGSTWSPLAAGMDSNGGYSTVRALAAFDDGTGAALYAGGLFTYAGGVLANHIAKWNGSGWSALGSGLGFSNNDSVVYAMTTFDDGCGLELVAGGLFSTAGGAPANSIAKWNGSTWSPLGNGMIPFAPNLGWVSALTAFDDGCGDSLFAGTAFSSAFDSGDSYLARWDDGTCSVGTGYCFGDAGCPCGNNGPAGSGCLNSLGIAGSLTAMGRALLSADSVVLSGAGMPNSSSLYFQATMRTNALFGDGLRCAFSSVIRLSTKLNASGASQYPEATDPPITVRGAITSPGIRNYQVWYRNAASFCTASTFNLTNGLEIAWTL